MSAIPPLNWRWNAAERHLTPLHAALACRHLADDHIYTLVEQETRSAATHAHYFAAVHQCWLSLPEAEAQRFSTAEHLRKYALIKAGYYDEASIVCSSRAEAARIRTFIAGVDDYAIVTVSGTVVACYTAKSQSIRAMGKKVFAQSKEAVFRVLSELLKVDVMQIPDSGAARYFDG